MTGNGTPASPPLRAEGRPPVPAQVTPTCPVCRARFRGSAACSRCGAELAPLMRLIVRAAGLRSAALEALSAGELQGAAALAGDAQAVHPTAAGRSLWLLARFLAVADVVPTGREDCRG
ncbi:MAG: hypothetical protein HY814_07530 [Candidatus Riflebacteria bacterium]|nr:hypothetical protein [Candidatus Riflebacteria bacterium]